jgi:hypothetical protein
MDVDAKQTELLREYTEGVARPFYVMTGSWDVRYPTGRPEDQREDPIEIQAGMQWEIELSPAPFQGETISWSGGNYGFSPVRVTIAGADDPFDGLPSKEQAAGWLRRFADEIEKHGFVERPSNWIDIPQAALRPMDELIEELRRRPNDA